MNGAEVFRSLRKLLILWSGRPGSNRRHSAWEADVLPLNYSRPDESIALPLEVGNSRPIVVANRRHPSLRVRATPGGFKESIPRWLKPALILRHLRHD